MRYVNLTFFFVSFSPMFSLFSFRFFFRCWRVENNVNESHAAFWDGIKSYKFFNNRNTQKWSKKKKQKTFFNFYCFSFSSFSQIPSRFELISNSKTSAAASSEWRQWHNSSQIPLKSPSVPCDVYVAEHIITYCPCERFPQLFVFFLSFYLTILMDSNFLRNNSLSLSLH